METVGLKELKNHLGEYVTKCRAGARIVITDRGREIAELTPLSASRQAMIDLREAGRVVWNGRKPSGLRGQAARGMPVAKTVIENRN